MSFLMKTSDGLVNIAGGGGTSDYNNLTNLPTINDVEIKDNKTADDLGLVAKDSIGKADGVAGLGSDGKVPSSQLPDPVAQKEYKLVEASTEGYAKSYKLQVKDGETWSDISGSASINIPKDMVVESGSVKECTTDNVPVNGYKKGDKYIDLVIANKADAHIYINVKDLIDNKAEGIQYSNITSKLTATNVQSAIDEIAALAKGNESDISDINEALEEKVNQTELLSFENDVYNRTGGGKNLLNLSTLSESTNRGVTFTPVYVDGVVDHILINGENDGTAESTYRFKSGYNTWGNNIASFICDDSNVRLLIGYYDASWQWKKNQAVYDGNEVVISSDQPLIQVTLYVSKGASLNNAKAYTMIRLPHIENSEYVPYIPTNSELNTELKTNLLSTVVASSNATANNSKILEFQGTGKNLEKLVVEGKTVQDGTPSPSAPVEVKGVGDKITYMIGAIDGSTGQNGVNNKPRVRIDDYLILNEGSYEIQTNSKFEMIVYTYKTDGTYISATPSNTWGSSKESITLSSDMKIRCMFRMPDDSAINPSECVITIINKNTGTSSVAAYKIPISCGGTTKNVYLNTSVFGGEKADVVSGVTEKKWGMMILDGTQVGASMASGRNHAVYGIGISNMKAGSRANGYCDRFVPANSWDQEGTLVFGTSGNNLYITFPDSLGISTIEQAKTWFAANPTTIVYPLATDTKETFDGAEIPTAVSKNTLTVDTDVTPTKVEVTSFGEYYSKAEVDRMLADKQDEASVLSFKDAIYNHTGGGKNLIGGYNCYTHHVSSGLTVDYEPLTSVITANGTSTTGTGVANLARVLYNKTIPKGKYRLSVFDITNAPVGWSVTVRKYSGGSVLATVDYWSATPTATFVLTEDTSINLFVRGDNTVTYDNFSCKVMLTYIDIIDDNIFVPYAPTNAELYKMIRDLHSNT